MNEILTDSGSVFFFRQLEFIKVQSYDVQYPQFRSFDLIPIERTVPAGAASITWHSYDKVGVAKIIADYAEDLPRIDIVGVETTTPIRQIGASYGYSTEDIRRAQFAGMPLEARRALATREAMDRKVDNIAWNGDANSGLKGFLTLANVPTANVANNAGATSKLWTAKTPAEILFDIINAIGTMKVLTNEIEIPDTLLIPTAQYNYLAGAMMPYSQTSVLSWLRINLTELGITDIQSLYLLKGAGANATDRFAIYKNDPMKLAQQITLDFTQYAPQMEGLNYTISCECKHGGVIAYYPLSIAFWDGI